VENVKPGDVYFNVIKESITPLLQTMFEDAVVSTMVNYTIDEAISNLKEIPSVVKKLLQNKLDNIESGIYADSVQLTRSEVPRQVKDAFEQSTLAVNESRKKRDEALTYATNTIQEAAGSVAEKLFAALHDESVDEEMLEYLWSESAGTAKERIAGARAYRTKVVKDAQANASYLMSLLPEYRKRPELVIQTIYLDAIQQIFDNAEEIFVVQTSEGSKGSEIRVQLNSDPSIKRKNNTEETEETTK
jgi:membrane protease subunit HflK